MKITDYDAITGEATVRDMDSAELLQIKQLQEAKENKQAEIENKLLPKQLAQAKLTALGLTADEVAAIIGN